MHEVTTVEEYRVLNRIIEDEFGLNWLTKKVKAADKGRWGKHSIPKLWKTAKDTLEEFDRTGVLNASKDLIALSAFAHDLSKVRFLPNYESSIKTRLKSAEFSKLQHEVHVGSLCVRSNYITEFVPRSDRGGVNTSDLKISTEWGDVYIEATKKDAYHSDISGSNVTFDSIWQQISEIQIETEANHDVLVFTVGTEIKADDLVHVISVVKHNIITNDEKLWLNVDKSYAVLVQRLSQLQGEGRQTISLPTSLNPGFAFGKVGTDDSGRKHFTNINRVALISLHSHKINSVLNTFTTKRRKKQIPKDGIGIIYINLDMDQVEDYRIPLYLDLVAAILQTKFTPSKNTRIGAVVLTTGPTFIESEVRGKPFITARRFLKTVRNIYGPLPENFVIP